MADSAVAVRNRTVAVRNRNVLCLCLAQEEGFVSVLCFLYWLMWEVVRSEVVEVVGAKKQQEQTA